MCWRRSLITSQVKEQPVDMDIIGNLVEPNVRVRRQALTCCSPKGFHILTEKNLDSLIFLVHCYQGFVVHVMIISIFTSPSTLWITISTRARTPQLVCILLNIGFLELQSIVRQIHIEKESDVWFGRHSQWLAQLADLPRQPFGLVFSLRSMQTSWGVLSKVTPTI